MAILMVLINFLLIYSVEINISNSVGLSILSSNSIMVRRYSNQGGKFESDFISYYLAGLIEGDGYFNTPKKLTTPSGTARVAGIEVVFALKDRPSAKLLQSLFGGKLYDHPNKNLNR